MAMIPQYHQGKLASSVVGTPGVDRSGSIMLDSAMQAQQSVNNAAIQANGQAMAGVNHLFNIGANLIGNMVQGHYEQAQRVARQRQAEVDARARAATRMRIEGDTSSLMPLVQNAIDHVATQYKSAEDATGFVSNSAQHKNEILKSIDPFLENNVNADEIRHNLSGHIDSQFTSLTKGINENGRIVGAANTDALYKMAKQKVIENAPNQSWADLEKAVTMLDKSTAVNEPKEVHALAMQELLTNARIKKLSFNATQNPIQALIDIGRATPADLTPPPGLDAQALMQPISPGDVVPPPLVVPAKKEFVPPPGTSKQGLVMMKGENGKMVGVPAPPPSAYKTAPIPELFQYKAAPPPMQTAPAPVEVPKSIPWAATLPPETLQSLERTARSSLSALTRDALSQQQQDALGLSQHFMAKVQNALDSESTTTMQQTYDEFKTKFDDLSTKPSTQATLQTMRDLQAGMARLKSNITGMNAKAAAEDLKAAHNSIVGVSEVVKADLVRMTGNKEALAGKKAELTKTVAALTEKVAGGDTSPATLEALSHATANLNGANMLYQRAEAGIDKAEKASAKAAQQSEKDMFNATVDGRAQLALQFKTASSEAWQKLSVENKVKAIQDISNAVRDLDGKGGFVTQDGKELKAKYQAWLKAATAETLPKTRDWFGGATHNTNLLNSLVAPAPADLHTQLNPTGDKAKADKINTKYSPGLEAVLQKVLEAAPKDPKTHQPIYHTIYDIPKDKVDKVKQLYHVSWILNGDQIIG